MSETMTPARCAGCGRGLGFEEWKRGLSLCPYCTSVPKRRPNSAGTRMPGPPPAAPTAPGATLGESHPTFDDYRTYERMVDDVPDDLLDELVAMLEAEIDRRPELAARMEAEGKRPAQGAVGEVLAEIGFARSPQEFQWAAWGFAAGFALNVVLAKYAQMSAGAPMGQFFVPMVIGGLVAGAACGAIGWGLAKIRERP